MDVKKMAQMLNEAEQEKFQITALTDEDSLMTVEDAYAIQLFNAQRRIETGEKASGMKIGLTSQGMQKLLGVNEPDYGHLFEIMEIQEGGDCPISELIQPKAEGELAFRLKKALKGPGITVEDVMEATAYVVPAIEIVDSRIKDWKIKLMDTIADNGSSARYVIGNVFKPVKDVDMRLCGMLLEKNGEPFASGTTVEVMGSPAKSLAWLANKLSEFGIELPENSIILTGAVTAAVSVKAGDVVKVSFCDLGEVEVKFV